jgi:hypothetical protein
LQRCHDSRISFADAALALWQRRAALSFGFAAAALAFSPQRAARHSAIWPAPRLPAAGAAPLVIWRFALRRHCSRSLRVSLRIRTRFVALFCRVFTSFILLLRSSLKRLLIPSIFIRFAPSLVLSARTLLQGRASALRTSFYDVGPLACLTLVSEEILV